MAQKATKESVSAATREPNYSSAIQLMRHAIRQKKDKIAELNGDIGGHWNSIVSYQVPKAAGQFWMKLEKLEPAERADILRGLHGLIDASGWDQPDLVDQAEQRDDDGEPKTGENVVPLRKGKAKAEPEAPAAEEPAPAPKKRGRPPKAKLSPAYSKDEAPAVGDEPSKSYSEVLKDAAPPPERLMDKMARLQQGAYGNGEKPATEPYTGDNSDLAGE